MFKIYDKMQSPNYTNSAPPITFLILDRSYDAVSPLLRDFYYMPLLYEYKKITKHTITNTKTKKAHHFDENDEIF